MYPSAPPPPKVPQNFKNVPGTAERKCTNAKDKPVLRSGEFVVGNVDQYLAAWKPNPVEGKLWWVPLHADQMPGLLVRATLLADPTTSYIYQQPLVAWGNGTRFYASGVLLPTAGTWMLIATSGPDWGCFILTVGASTPAPTATSVIRRRPTPGPPTAGVGVGAPGQETQPPASPAAADPAGCSLPGAVARLTALFTALDRHAVAAVLATYLQQLFRGAPRFALASISLGDGNPVSNDNTVIDTAETAPVAQFWATGRLRDGGAPLVRGQALPCAAIRLRASGCLQGR